MTLLGHVRRVRLILAAGAVVRALAWAVLVATAIVVATAVVDLAVPLSRALRGTIPVVAAVAGAGVAVFRCWRDRAVLSSSRVALWLEEQFPGLQYRLISNVESTAVGSAETSADALHTERWTPLAARRAGKALLGPVTALVVIALLSFILPTGAIARVRSPHLGDALGRGPLGAGGAGSKLAPLVARVTPPAYSRRPDSTIEEPNEVHALVGSGVTLTGRGEARGLHVAAGTQLLPVRQNGEEWTVALHAGAKPIAIRLNDRGVERIVALEPIVDRPPQVTLSAPAHDTVLRASRGRMSLSADVTDDFGVASAAFEYIISSGEGENFTFRAARVGAVRSAGKRVPLSATLSLDSLALKPGDVLHVRAVAVDGNVVSGPDSAASETHTVRIARADENDSVAVNPARPSDTDRSFLSERMLIGLAQALARRRADVARDTLIAESRRIAVDQRALRRSVGDVVFLRLGGQPGGEEQNAADAAARAKTMAELLERADAVTNRSRDPLDFPGDESPVVATNKPLLEAYDAMWDAGTQLELGQPGRALPFMYRALGAIQRARQAERHYLRGRVPAAIVDVERVRLTGKERGVSSERQPVGTTDSASHARLNRYVRAVELAGTDARAAVDSLLLLRIDALTDAPVFAGAVGEAVTAMRRGNDATAALTRARRALAGPVSVSDSLARWKLAP